MLLAGGVPQRSIEEVGDRIRTAVARPIQVLDRSILVGVSIGAAATNDRAYDALTLIQRADAALYRAKAARPPFAATAATLSTVSTAGGGSVDAGTDDPDDSAALWSDPAWSLTRPELAWQATGRSGTGVGRTTTSGR